MQKIIICPSVQHTGHNFMRYRIFEPVNYKAWPPHHEITDKEQNYVLMGHFNDHLFNWFDFKDYSCYIPLRHPARVLESFVRRNTVDTEPAQFFAHWRAMMRFVESLDSKPMFLHLDMGWRRHYQAQNILHSLGHSFKVDWSATEETGCKKGTHDLELTEELISKVPQDFIDFYEEMKK